MGLEKQMKAVTKAQPTENEDDAACLHAMQYVGAALSTMTLNTALELNIFGIIRNAGPNAHLSASEIASHFPRRHERTAGALDSMLRLLVSHSFLTCCTRNTEDGSPHETVYGLAPAVKFLSSDPRKGSMAPMIALANHKCIVDLWIHMKDVLLEGGDQFKKRNGLSMFEFSHSDAAFNDVYSNAMSGVSALFMSKILEVYKGFEGLKSVVDIGGGYGQIISMVVDKYGDGSIKGINFDLPHVIQSAPPHRGVEHVAGDMFVSVPKADAVILKDVLHNWSDEHCVKVLKNCYDAIPEKGKVIIICMIPEAVPDCSPASRFVATMDYIMALQYSGKERTEKQLHALCNASGFTKCHVVFLAYGAWSVVEFLK